MPTRAELLASLPRKRVAAGALIRDERGRVLLVEPTCRDDRLTPGARDSFIELDDRTFVQ